MSLPALAAVLLLGAAAPAEIARGVSAVGMAASEAPAMRQESQAGEPSPGFQLGAALAAWINASAQLDFDLKNPGAAGPPHAHLAQDGDSFLRDDCRDEAAAFGKLESRSQALSLTPERVFALAGTTLGGSAADWLQRKKGQADACR